MPDQTRILVTGGTGLVGSCLLRMLIRKGYIVRAIRRKESRMDLVEDLAGKVEWVEGDVTDVIALEDALQDVTHVFHAAALISFHPGDVSRMMRVNVDGTSNIVNLSLEAGVRKFIHVSSIASIGRLKSRPILDESLKWVQSKGNSNYAISKYLSEQEVWRGHAEGLPVAIVNPSMILGSGFWDSGTAKFFKQIDEGLKFVPVGRSGFVDVRDVCRFMINLLESDISGERYILNADNMPYREFFGLVATSIHKKPPFITVTPFLAEVAWRVEWLKEKLLRTEPMVTRESARASVSAYAYANEKSRSVFGFEYLPISQTVAEIGAQFLEAKLKDLKPVWLDIA